MPPSSLPARPNLEQLRKQAKDLLKAYRSGDSSVIARFRTSFSRYSGFTDYEPRQSPPSLADAQRIVAKEYGFQDWLEMRNYVERKEGTSMIEMTVDHVRMNYVSDQRVVVLKAKEDERRLPIWIGKAAGDAIAMELQGQQMPRPMTHSLMHKMLGDLEAEVEKVVVSDIVDGTFFAVLRVKTGKDAIEYDARPSDAIALAVHSGAPLFAAPEVVAKAGIALNPETGEILPVQADGEESPGEHGDGPASHLFRAAEGAMGEHWHIYGRA